MAGTIPINNVFAVTETQKITASDAAAFDQFGRSVSISSDTVIVGGDGSDTIRGNIGKDVIDGDADNDTISGDIGNDVLDGGTGDDTIKGGNGIDEIDGNQEDTCDTDNQDKPTISCENII